MSNAIKLPSNFTLYTDNWLSTVTFSQDDIVKIIQNLNPNKANGHDNVNSVRIGENTNQKKLFWTLCMQ